MNRRQPNLASSDLHFEILPFEALKCTNNVISTTYSDRGHLKLLKGNIYLISGANIEVKVAKFPGARVQGPQGGALGLKTAT